MAIQNRIQILRSTDNASVPTLNAGEFAYTANGDVLFIGHPDGASGNIRVGGEQTPGVLTANQALVANSTSGIDSLKTDSFTLNTYAVTSVIDDNTFTTGVSNTSLASSESIKAYVDSVAGAGVSNLDDVSDVTVASPVEGHVLTWDATESSWVDADIVGGTGITSSYANGTNSHTISLDNTAVTDGSYGDANTVATFTVDAQGRLTAAGSADINHDTLLNFVANEHINHSSVSITAGNGLTGGGDITTSRTLTVLANNGITVTADGVFVDGANGISVDATGVNVQASDNTIAVGTGGIAVNEGNLSIATTQLTGSITFSQLAGAAVITSGETLASNDVDTAIPTAAAVIDYVDAVDLTTGISNNSTNSTVSTSQTLTIQGTNNEVEVGLSGQTFTVGLPNDVTVGNNLTVTGNLTVNGTTTTVDTTQLLVEDNLIGLAVNNTTDAVDIGFYGQYNDGADKYTGLIRDASDADSAWKLVENLTNEPGVANTDLYDATGEQLAKLYVGDLNASAVTAASLSLTTDLAVTHGGTGASSFTDNGIIYGNGTSALSVTAAGTQYQVLQAGSGGVPEWGSLDGGTF